MIENSLLRLEPPDMNKIALECFASIMRYRYTVQKVIQISEI